MSSLPGPYANATGAQTFRWNSAALSGRFDEGCSLREDADGTCSSNKAGTEETIMKAIALVASAALVCLAPAVRAADYPTKPITFMIGFAPGGPSDVMARILPARWRNFSSSRW